MQATVASYWDTMDTGIDSIGRVRVPSSYKKLYKKAKLKAKELSRMVSRAGAWVRARRCLGINQTYSQYMKKLISEYKLTSYDFALDDYNDILRQKREAASLEEIPSPEEIQLKKARVESLYKEADIVVQKYIALYKCLLHKTISWDEARYILQAGFTGNARMVRSASNFQKVYLTSLKL